MANNAAPLDGANETMKTGEIEKPPSGIRIMWREIVRDKMALISFIFIVLLGLFVFGTDLLLNQDEIVEVDLLSIYAPPGEEFWLGTDYGGRDIFGQLIIGTKNSLLMGIMVTAMSAFIGIVLGIVAGFYGGHVDNVIMRVHDFFNILPNLMFMIVFAVIVPKYSPWTFSLVMMAFLWMGTARMVRSKALAERELEYIQAAKTVGTSDIKTMFTHMMPNISSLIIVNLTLSLAANIGIESGLSFLGFGLPEGSPSLGTLMSYATNPETLQYRWWIWLPASLLILILMLCVRNVGEALKRATDARQRRG